MQKEEDEKAAAIHKEIEDEEKEEGFWLLWVGVGSGDSSCHSLPLSR